MLLYSLFLLHTLLTNKGLQADDVTAAAPLCNTDGGWRMSFDDCLLIGEASKTWAASRSTCNGLRADSDLASFPDPKHDQNLLTWLSTASPYSTATPYWVGYHFSQSDFKWLSGTPTEDASRFQTASSSSQNLCGSVLLTGNGTHRFLQWRLEDCTLPYRFLCMVNNQTQDRPTKDIGGYQFISPQNLSDIVHKVGIQKSQLSSSRKRENKQRLTSLLKSKTLKRHERVKQLSSAAARTVSRSKRSRSSAEVRHRSHDVFHRQFCCRGMTPNGNIRVSSDARCRSISRHSQGRIHEICSSKTMHPPQKSTNPITTSNIDPSKRSLPNNVLGQGSLLWTPTTRRMLFGKGFVLTANTTTSQATTFSNSNYALRSSQFPNAHNTVTAANVRISNRTETARNKELFGKGYAKLVLQSTAAQQSSFLQHQASAIPSHVRAPASAESQTHASHVPLLITDAIVTTEHATSPHTTQKHDTSAVMSSESSVTGVTSMIPLTSPKDHLSPDFKAVSTVADKTSVAFSAGTITSSVYSDTTDVTVEERSTTQYLATVGVDGSSVHHSERVWDSTTKSVKVTSSSQMVMSAKTSAREILDYVQGSECEIFEDCMSRVLLNCDLPAQVKLDVLNSDLVPCPSCDSDHAETASNSSGTSDRWTHNIEYFFWILNRFLGGAYNHYDQTNHQVLKSVLLTMEHFLNAVMSTSYLTTDMHRSFSQLEFQIKQLPTRDDIANYQYQDGQQLCSISHVDFGHRVARRKTAKFVLISVVMNAFAKIVLISVVMNVLKGQRMLTSSGEPDEEKDGVIGSPVLLFSGYVGGLRYSLRHSFTLRQQVKSKTAQHDVSYKPRCGFLDHSSWQWSTYGCKVVVAEDGKDNDEHSDENNDDSNNLGQHGIVSCRCNHTSNFAILMQVVPFTVSEAHRVALSIITYIGCSVTLITQFMAITVFTCIRSLNCERVCVHRNLCIAIVGAQVTFLAGIEAVEHRLICSAVAVLLHYCYTAVFIWMLVEGLHLYSKVVRVFGTERSRMTYYVCFGWGVPIILVTISAAADWEGYGTTTSCWLSIRRNTIWAFVGPALSIIIVNLVILAAVVKIVMASAKLDKHGEFDHIRAGVKAALLLLPLLGLTWIFGLAAVNKDLIIFQYLFAFFNTLQGFFIFLFHCVFNTEVRQALKRLQERRSLQKSDLSSLVGFTTSPSVSPTPSVQSPDLKKALGRGDSPTDSMSTSYKTNRVAPARYTTTTNIISHTSVPTIASSVGVMSTTNRERRTVNQTTVRRKTEEMSLMYI